MQDAKYWPLFLLCWLVFLGAAIVTGRKQHRGPVTCMAHFASWISLVVGTVMISMLNRDYIKIDHSVIVGISWIISTVLVNMMITAIAGSIWPRCKKCGAEMMPTNYDVGRGTPDHGYVIIKECPNRCTK